MTGAEADSPVAAAVRALTPLALYSLLVDGGGAVDMMTCVIIKERFVAESDARKRLALSDTVGGALARLSLLARGPDGENGRLSVGDSICPIELVVLISVVVDTVAFGVSWPSDVHLRLHMDLAKRHEESYRRIFSDGMRSPNWARYVESQRAHTDLSAWTTPCTVRFLKAMRCHEASDARSGRAVYPDKVSGLVWRYAEVHGDSVRMASIASEAEACDGAN
jgi:hypothetical protein